MSNAALWRFGVAVTFGASLAAGLTNQPIALIGAAIGASTLATLYTIIELRKTKP
jgi:hypothetical protein